MNAWAQRNGPDNAGFTFNAGMAFALGDVLPTLLAQPDFYPEVLLSPGSTTKGPEVAGRFYDYSWLRATSGSAAPRFVPHTALHDEGRYKLRDHLVEMAIQFVLLHEYAHFFLGHLAYLGG
jgi:hypothetical protein